MGYVGPERRPQQRRLLRHRRLHIDHHRQLLVLDGHQLRRVDGMLACLGDHDGDDLAHEPDDVSRQGLAAEQPFDLRLRVALNRARRWKRREAQVGCDVDTCHTWSGPRGTRASIPATFACGMMERTKAAWSAPGISMLSRYRPSPRRNRGSSDRRAGTPNMEGGAVATAPILAAEGADDMRRTERDR